MTFPATPINVTVEILVNAVWTDITTDVMVRDGITITRGRGDETGSASPAQCTLTLNNRQGKYSPRNPLGTYYGQLTLNTQLRVSVDGVRRFWGEVAEWPPRWDMSTKDAYVPLTANGVLRRLGQGRAAVAGYKGYLLSTSPVTYWPLDDGSSSTQGYPAAGTYRESPLRRALGSAVFEFGAGNLGIHLAPSLRLNDTDPPGGSTDPDFLRGACAASAFPDALAMDFVYKCDQEIVPGTMTADTEGFKVTLVEQGPVNGQVNQWDLSFRHDGTNNDAKLDLTVYNDAGITTTAVGNSAPLTAVTDVDLHHVRLLLTQNGANVDCTVYVDGTSVLTATVVSQQLRSAREATVRYARTSNTTDALMAFGHLIVWRNAANIPDITTTSNLAHGYLGEVAGRRFERLCAEQDFTFVSSGNLDDTLPMGLQFTDDPMTLLLEVEATDGGMIYEPRTSLAVGYRTRASLCNQSAVFTLSQSAGQVAAPLEPTDDDHRVRNDIVTTRREGASYEAVKSTGPLSVLDPPNGAGRYKDEATVNVETDDDIPGVAGWLLLLGTVDEPRYPQVVVERAASAIAANLTLSSAIMTADVGDRVVLNSTDALTIYDDISQLVIGYTETIEPFSHRFAFTCVPESPYEVMELDGVNSWLDPGDASTLSSSATSTATSLSVATTDFLWSTSGSDYPVGIKIAGEEMTVTAVSGAASPQTFTVTRSVNGVVKAQASGAQVNLKRPGVLGL